jgi:hypothetical protein
VDIEYPWERFFIKIKELILAGREAPSLQKQFSTVMTEDVDRIGFDGKQTMG